MAKYLPFLVYFLVPSFYSLLCSFQVESILEQNPGEQPHEVGCNPEARNLCALYVAVSILLQLSEKPTSVSS